jgi:hypothetical protein
MSYPQNVIIKMSRFRILLDATAILMVPFGICLLVQWGGWAKLFMALFCIIYGIISVFANYHELLQYNTPQIIISAKGIQTNDGKYYEWHTINNAKIIEEKYGRYSSYFLCFEVTGLNRQIPVTWLTKSPQEILSLVKQYSGEVS